MKLWTFHPRYLDTCGLTGLWREAIMAQNILIKLLQGKIVGYANHPELNKIRNIGEPIFWEGAIKVYLDEIYKESVARKHSFNRRKITASRGPLLDVEIWLPEDQLRQEEETIKERLAIRSPGRYKDVKDIRFEPHPLFILV